MVVLSIVILVFWRVLCFFSNTAGHTLQGTSHVFPSLEMENHRLKFVPLKGDMLLPLEGIFKNFSQ